ncbi:MAG: DUF364 domain-containing protein [Desulfobacterales bacterium]|jgi:hypothetical protein
MMTLDQNLYDLFADKADEEKIEILSLGLGYTVVTLSGGGIGLSYTYFQNKTSCVLLNKMVDYENRPAAELLEHIKSENTIERSMALALINALNHDQALKLPEDKKNQILFDEFQIGKGSRIAMVGYFGPLVHMLQQRNTKLEILDESRKLGQKDEFYKKLGNWADVLFLTSTSILNNTTETILGHAHSNIKTVMLGPSTPMVGAAFEHLPVNMLAGTVPIDQEKIVKAIRHGMGTPVLHRYSRKVFLDLSD